METISDALATESFGKRVERARSKTLPGASDHLRLDVNGTHTTVEMRLKFRLSPWTISTGRRRPGPEPVGSGRSAHQMSP